MLQLNEFHIYFPKNKIGSAFLMQKNMLMLYPKFDKKF